MTEKEIVKVIQAHMNEKEIEEIHVNQKIDFWNPSPNPTWDFKNYKYRVKEVKKTHENLIKMLWNKIKPLDYKNSPIGSFKLEMLFWILILPTIAFLSGMLYNKIEDVIEINNTSLLILLQIFSIVVWVRLSIILQRHIIDKKFKKIK